jgi:Glucose-6-phosphate dehydrogenase, NAD binding domain
MTDSPAVAPPCAMVIFGAAGDLTRRLIVPALYNLAHARWLPEEFQLVGVDLAAQTAEQWRPRALRVQARDAPAPAGAHVVEKVGGRAMTTRRNVRIALALGIVLGLTTSAGWGQTATPPPSGWFRASWQPRPGDLPSTIQGASITVALSCDRRPLAG